MANTFVKIATVNASGSSSTIDFTSIPSTYTDLVVKISARSTSGAAVYAQVDMTFNGTSTNRTNRMLYGTGSAAASTNGTNFTWEVNGAASTASTFANSEIYIPNYAGSTNKSFSIDSVQETNATASYADLLAGLWASTAAINQITITMNATYVNFAQYSTATLYGISKS